jgi:DNA-binding Lrp family transcriptional regulator
MYRRYTLDEVKRKIIEALQDNATGLSGVELASTAGINRMTITKYLNILETMRLIKKKKVGSVNVWFAERGTDDYEFPVNYLEVQQKFMNAIMLGDADQARNILISVINSNIELLRILTDIIVPTLNTVNELYNRGRLGKTERIYLLNLILELIDLLKFTIQPALNVAVIRCSWPHLRTESITQKLEHLHCRFWGSEHRTSEISNSTSILFLILISNAI